jgi:hypothetical protein
VRVWTQDQHGSGDFFIQFAAITHVAADKRADKICRNTIAGKREGMPTEQLLQMPAVRTDRFSII